MKPGAEPRATLSIYVIARIRKNPKQSRCLVNIAVLQLVMKSGPKRPGPGHLLVIPAKAGIRFIRMRVNPVCKQTGVKMVSLQVPIDRDKAILPSI